MRKLDHNIIFKKYKWEGHGGVEDLHFYKWSYKKKSWKMNLGDDEESPVVHCATNHGDQLSKLQNPKCIKTEGVLIKLTM